MTYLLLAEMVPPTLLTRFCSSGSLAEGAIAKYSTPCEIQTEVIERQDANWSLCPGLVAERANGND